jgi:hypothetical protein
MKKTLKKSTWILAIATASIVFTSCGEQRSVKRAATTFLQSYYIDHDFETALSLVTEITFEDLQVRAMVFASDPFAAEEGFRSFSITNFDVKKTKAVVSYTLDERHERLLLLSKVGGRWLIDMPDGVVFANPMHSLSLRPRSSGGFASAQGGPFRIGDVPKAATAETTENTEDTEE